MQGGLPPCNVQQRAVLPLGLTVVQRAPSLSSGLERACVVVLRVRPAIRARHTRVKTGVGSALCKDESEGFRQGKKGRNCEAARCTQSSYVRQMCCRGDVDDAVAAELDRDVVARAWSNARPATL